MTLKEFDVFNDNKKDILTVSDLSDARNRTLLYGYTYNDKTFHVYVKRNKIFTVVYNEEFINDTVRPKQMQQVVITSNNDYIPKRLYPETCDYEFCKLLKDRNIILPFTNYNNERCIKDFYGFTLDNI